MRSGKINYAGVGVAVGGLFGVLGVYADWFKFTYHTSGGSLTATLSGTADWTGQVAVVAGFAALLGGAAYVLLDSDLRRVVGPFMGAASAVLLVMAVFGAIHARDVAVPVVGVGGLRGVTASWGIGLLVTFVGSVVGFVGSMLAINEKPEPGVVATDAAETTAA